MSIAPLSDEFLAILVAELDNDDIVGITLGGSYVRGEATPYSDVDIACYVKDDVQPGPMRFFYRDGLLVSIVIKKVASIRAMLLKPEAAILFVNGKRRILLDKDGSVSKLCQEIAALTWESLSLQEAAERYANFGMTLAAEFAHKILGAAWQGNDLAMAYATAKLLSELTEIVAVQRGVLVTSDSTYYRQVQETVGLDSAWTCYHRIATGVDAAPAEVPPVIARGVAALYLYKETLPLLRPIMQPAHLTVAEQAVRVIDEALPRLQL